MGAPVAALLVCALDRRVPAPVVDENQFPRPSRADHGAVHRLDERRDVPLFVVERYDDGYVREDLGFGHIGTPGEGRAQTSS